MRTAVRSRRNSSSSMALRSLGLHPLPQRQHLVAQTRSHQEVEVFGGAFHLAFEAFHLLGKLVFGHVLRHRVGGELEVFSFGVIARAARFAHHVGDAGLFQNGLARAQNRLRRDAVGFVVLHLNRAAAVGFVNGLLHRTRHPVGVHEHFSPVVAGGAANRLNQRADVAQEAFLVGVHDGHERDFG